MKWFIYTIKHSFNYKGRARRAEYGWFLLFMFLINLILSILAFVTASFDLISLHKIVLAVTTFIQYAYFIPTISLNIRRLHDLGLSGWWSVILYLFNGYLTLQIYLSEGSISSEAVHHLFSQSSDFRMLSYLYFAVSLIICLIFILKDGQPKENKYGTSPKQSIND